MFYNQYRQPSSRKQLPSQYLCPFLQGSKLAILVLDDFHNIRTHQRTPDGKTSTAVHMVTAVVDVHLDIEGAPCADTPLHRTVHIADANNAQRPVVGGICTVDVQELYCTAFEAYCHEYYLPALPPAFRNFDIQHVQRSAEALR